MGIETPSNLKQWSLAENPGPTLCAFCLYYVVYCVLDVCRSGVGTCMGIPDRTNSTDGSPGTLGDTTSHSSGRPKMHTRTHRGPPGLASIVWLRTDGT